MSNRNLHSARKAKQDEFYTSRRDVETEVSQYVEHLRGKVVYCNCDCYTWSNFYLYLKDEFSNFGIKRLIATGFNPGGRGFKAVVENGVETLSELEGNGDFRSPECIELLKESDVVVTNPPFSLFREFVATLMEHDVKFIVIGSTNAITYKEVFKHIQADDLWLGMTSVKEFIRPDGSTQKFGNIIWFTNLPHRKRESDLFLFHSINDMKYPKYDNYDAIEVSRVCNIPVDYDGVMGVPITFLEHYNPEQFEIVDLNPHFFIQVALGLPKPKQLKIEGQKDPYARILIRKRQGVVR